MHKSVRHSLLKVRVSAKFSNFAKTGTWNKFQTVKCCLNTYANALDVSRTCEKGKY